VARVSFIPIGCSADVWCLDLPGHHGGKSPPGGALFNGPIPGATAYMLPAFL